MINKQSGDKTSLNKKTKFALADDSIIKLNKNEYKILGSYKGFDFIYIIPTNAIFYKNSDDDLEFFTPEMIEIEKEFKNPDCEIKNECDFIYVFYSIVGDLVKQLAKETKRADDLFKNLYVNERPLRDKLIKEMNRSIKSETDLQQANGKLKPFQDQYFKDLPMESIAELAKKSIRLTTANSELEEKLEKARNFIENSYFDTCKERGEQQDILQEIK